MAHLPAGVQWSTSLISFYQPERLGADDLDQLRQKVSRDPASFWTKMLDEVASTGVRGIEMSIPPGDWVSARAAFDGPGEFAKQLAARRLTLTSSYMSGHPIRDAIADDTQRGELLERVADHAEFVRRAGGDLMLMGPAKRTVDDNGPVEEVEADLLGDVAEMVNECGRVAHSIGVRYAMHTEAYSVLARNEDVDRLMAATDPARVLLCPDLGHVTLDGGNPLEMFAMHRSRIPIAHWKDCLAPRAGDGTTGLRRHDRMIESFRPAGLGSVDWDGWIALLAEHDFEGWAIAEVDLSPRPVEEVSGVLDRFPLAGAGETS